MDTAIYFILSIVYDLLLVIGLISARKDHWPISSLFLLLVIAALFYDNSILALGRYIGEGRLLESLNAPRYWMHAFFTPLLLPFVWQNLRNAGIAWTKTPLATLVVLLVTATIILLEAIPLLNLNLQPVLEQGVLSYRRVSDSGGPIMIIAVTLSIFLASILLWRKQGWKGLFIGLILMGVVGGLTIPFESKAIGNISELVLILSLFATQLFQKKVAR